MKRWIKENRRFLLFFFCFGFVRLAIADWNPIPSGSMRPTLLEGDVVLVNRLAYDFKIPLTDTAVFTIDAPRRGDVIVFISPKDGMRLIKRLVAVPGDVVEMRNEILYINGIAATYSEPEIASEPIESGGTLPSLHYTEKLAGSERRIQVLPNIRAKRNFGPTVIPPENYFFLGDNRDNSADSRYIGLVPRHYLIGRAHHLLASADIKGNWLPRVRRFGEKIE